MSCKKYLSEPTLETMLTYRRPSGSGTERAFIKRFIRPLGAEYDGAGNLILKIGDAPVMWSSHTDTVHHKEGLQTVILDGGSYKLGKEARKSCCLGADCTTGVWIMCEMARAKVPGLYIWHRGEEVGGVGSKHIANKTPNLLKGINFAIAFDRKGTDSIITHQGHRTASTTFAESLAAQMPGFSADSGGMFTDTANYTSLVSECTNVSIGYSDAHSSGEAQIAAFPGHVVEMMKALDVSKLVAARDPSANDVYDNYDDWGFDDWSRYGSPSYGSSCVSPYSRFTRASDEQIYEQETSWKRHGVQSDLYKLVRDYPAEVADLLEQYGINGHDILQNIGHKNGPRA
jgi:hypothetical protein